MNKLLYIIVFLVLTAVSSCEIETSGNGKLDGYWHLTSIDTIATDGVKDVNSDRIFWAVQGELIQFYNPDLSTDVYYISRFTYEKKELQLLEMRVNNRPAGDPLVENLDLLRPYGVNSLSEKYIVEQLSNGHLTLRSDMLLLHFRRM